jgi:hypothetical protein
VESGRGSRQPEGTRTTAPDQVRPRNATATWTRPSATPSYGDQLSDEPALHGHGGLPSPRPPTVRPLHAVSPDRGTRRTRHGHGRPLRASRARATSSLQLDPATHARTAHHTIPRGLRRLTTRDSDGPRYAGKRPAARAHPINIEQSHVSSIRRPR